jgi:BlaI family transcriptional regulator, penicillinase repressor
MAGLRLPEAELDVLACLHKQRRATARQIREALARVRPMTHGSVVTLLRRLESKSLVRRQKGDSGKAFIYEPTRDPAPTYRNLVRKLLERVFGGDSLALVTSLFETKPPTAEELVELERLVERLRERRKTHRRQQ